VHPPRPSPRTQMPGAQQVATPQLGSSMNELAQTARAGTTRQESQSFLFYPMGRVSGVVQAPQELNVYSQCVSNIGRNRPAGSRPRRLEIDAVTRAALPWVHEL
jgi:hypothetical protein